MKKIIRKIIPLFIALFFLIPLISDAQVMPVSPGLEQEDFLNNVDPFGIPDNDSSTFDVNSGLDSGAVGSPQGSIFTAEEVARIQGGQLRGYSQLEGLLIRATSIINSSVIALTSIAVLIFLWGLVIYLRTEKIEEKKQSIKFIGWGLAFLFIILSVWGIVNVLIYTLDLDNALKEITVDQIPEVKGVAAPNEVDDIEGFLTVINSVIGILIPIIILLAVLVFMWGILQYINAKDDNTRKDSINVIIYGIISLFVMVSVWGLVNVIASTFGINISGQERVNTNTQKVEDLLPSNFK